MSRRNRVLLAAVVIALIGGAFAAGALLVGRPRGAMPGAGGPRILYYRNPMNPQVTSPVPKKDSMGMDYVPVYATGTGVTAAAPPPGAGPSAVHIDPRITQNMGVTTEKAEVRDLTHIVRTVGIVQPDERRLYSITVKFSGWVERLYVDFTGDLVTKGEPLADVYSPELLATEREYVTALEHAKSIAAGGSAQARADADRLVSSARRRLQLWGISDSEIAALARNPRPTRSMTIDAPANGVVLEKNVTAGSQVAPGMTLLRIADLATVWVFAQVYPDQLPWVRLGEGADVEVQGVPGRVFPGKVGYVQPTVSAARTVEVRVQVAQPADGIVLKPNMYASVAIRSPLGRRGIVVSEQAIIRTGERNVAVVALGGGYFEPRKVTLGPTSDGHVEVLDGIAEGEEVVTSAEFLIDSDSNLKTTLNAMRGPPGAAGAPAPPANPPATDHR